MSILNTLLWIQQVHAVCTNWDCDQTLLDECTQKYANTSWNGISPEETVTQQTCMCTASDNIVKACSTLPQDYLDQKLCSSNAPKYSTWTITNNQGSCTCPAWETKDWSNECINNAYGNLGIQCAPEQMRNGTCSRNINKTLGIKESNTTSNPTLFVQDIVLAATSFIGTLMVIALIVMWFKYVMWGMDESSTGDLKGNIKKLLIWLGLVIGSYTIIRLIQYIARGY